MKITPNYGHESTSYREAGGEEGIRKLVDVFYDIMASELAYKTIRSWHPDDLKLSRDKLTAFLCAWMGGPNLYRQKYGSISIPAVHAHLNVTVTERDQWLGCMEQALLKQKFSSEFIEYLLKQLYIPAERIRAVCEK